MDVGQRSRALLEMSLLLFFISLERFWKCVQTSMRIRQQSFVCWTTDEFELETQKENTSDSNEGKHNCWVCKEISSIPKYQLLISNLKSINVARSKRLKKIKIPANQVVQLICNYKPDFAKMS